MEDDYRWRPHEIAQWDQLEAETKDMLGSGKMRFHALFTYNDGGSPLMAIIVDPDAVSPEEVIGFLRQHVEAMIEQYGDPFIDP